MTFRLMAVDIDGTLLDNSGNLTDNTKKTIRCAVERGLIFTIATGRPIQGVEYLNKMLELDVPFITYNGAMVVMGKSKKIIYEQKLSSEDARSIIALGEKYGVTVMVWKNNGLCVRKLDDRVHQYKKISGVEPVVIEAMDELVEGGVTKVLWYDEEKKIGEYQQQMGSLLRDSINYHTSRPYFLEFVDRYASKAIAMQKLGEHFGISQSEMIAVGDGYNDLSMIEYAGLGVAMENAPDAIKEKADFVTLSNDKDGIAHVIHQFVLEK